MADQANTTRRSFLKAAPAAAAVAAVPAVAQAKKLDIEDYPLADRAEFYARRLAESMEARHGGTWFAKVDDEFEFALVVPAVKQVSIVKDDGPLLADDVTGTTAYADWAAKQRRND